MKLTSLAFIASVLLLAGADCARTAKPSPAEFDKVPERVTIADRDYTLSAELWRDFMPIAPPDGHPLRAIVRVLAADGNPVPADLKAVRIWLISGKEQWSPKAPDAEPGRPGLELNLADGPKWTTGATADVVVELQQDKKTWRLRAAGLAIRRTD